MAPQVCRCSKLAPDLVLVFGDTNSTYHSLFLGGGAVPERLRLVAVRNLITRARVHDHHLAYELHSWRGELRKIHSCGNGASTSVAAIPWGRVPPGW